MFFVLSKILNILLHPLLWVFILMLLALLLKGNHFRRLFLILAVAVLFFFGHYPLANFFMNRWEYPAKTTESIQYHDYGILLSGMGAYHKKSGSFYFYEESDRIIQAFTLYKQGKLDKLILSGGTGRLFDRRHKESAYLKSYLMRWGIPETDILIDSTSRNTYENARNTYDKYYNPQSSYLLITSAFHMRRALACFHQQGMNPGVFPTGPNKESSARDLIYYVLPRAEAFEKWNILIKEWMGYLAYDVMGYL